MIYPLIQLFLAGFWFNATTSISWDISWRRDHRARRPSYANASEGISSL